MEKVLHVAGSRLIGLMVVGLVSAGPVGCVGVVGSQVGEDEPVAPVRVEGRGGVDPSPFGEDEIPDLTVPGVVSEAVTPAAVIDTRLFDPQIVDFEVDLDAVRAANKEQEEEFVPLVRASSGALRGVTPGGLRGDSVIEAGSVGVFDAIGQTRYLPPDPTVAVGPDHVMVTVNSAIAWYSRDGVLQVQQDLEPRGFDPGFFGSVGAGDFVFDPKCFYDHLAGRFVLVALERYLTTSYILMAVSDDADPNGVWHAYRTPSVLNIGNSLYWWDYPGFGFDGEVYSVTGNMFNLAGPGFGGGAYRTYDKAAMLVGDPVTTRTVLAGGSSSIQSAQEYGDENSSAPTGYFASALSGGSIRLLAMRNRLTQPYVLSADVPVPGYGGAPLAPVSGGGSLSIVPTRVMNVHVRGASLFTSHSVGVDGVAKVRWYEFDLGTWPESGSPTLVQVGEVNPGADTSVFFPAIAANAAGDVGLVYATSSPSDRVEMWITGRLAGDPPGTMGEPVRVALSPSGVSASQHRWGDYYDLTVDPTDDETMWAVGQVETDFGWQTKVASFRVGAPPVGCGLADVADPIGVLDLADISTFVGGFAVLDPVADVSEPFGTWDLQDIAAFVGAFAAGCP